MDVRSDMSLAEFNVLDEETMEEVTFGVDSGAAVTVIGVDTASDYPRSRAGPKRRMTDCQGNEVKDLGEKDLAFAGEGVSGRPTFARVTVAPVKKSLLAVSSMVRHGHEVVFRPGEYGGSLIKHLKTGAVKKLKAVGGVYEATFRLQAFSGRR